MICGGPSLRGFDWSNLEGLTVIGVNSAALHCRCDYFFTLDPTGATLDAIGLVGAKKYIAWRKRLPIYDATWLQVMWGDGWQGSYRGFSREPDRVANGNSGHGALNLALLMGASKVAMLGLDGTQGHFYDEAGEPFDHLPAMFWASMKDLTAEVLNGSPESRIDCFERMSPEEAVRRIRC